MASAGTCIPRPGGKLAGTSQLWRKVLQIGAILAWGPPQQLTKYSGHMRVAPKSAKGGDIDERGGSFSHQVLCALQPELQQITVWREPRRSLEHSQKMAPAVAALGWQCLEIQVADKVVHALQTLPAESGYKIGRAQV